MAPKGSQDGCGCSGGSGPSCCGGPGQDDRSGPHEKPGYTLNGFVEDFADTPAGSVPRVRTRLSACDLSRHAAARMGIARSSHRVTPGLYCVGKAGAESPVLVTANYSLSFDALRKELSGIAAWILVLDTRGVNVWCAAGKKTFSTGEVVLQVQQTRLETVVSHKRLVLPQLGAVGVNAHAVKKGCGFEVLWGPVRAADIPAFLKNGMKCTRPMRRVRFSLLDRLVLIPVEVSIMARPAAIVALLLFLLSGIGPGVFSFSASWHRGLMLVTSLALGILAGAVVTPALLPYIPGAAFSKKGALTGIAAALAAVLLHAGTATFAELFALAVVAAAFSSYLAMNFTGATPFTSPSGVEKEMRAALPFQGGALLTALLVWIGAAF
ncbi:MAG: hypothetical protein KKA60_09965 [Proteobacteria bacterium]|nr:hypothetical protein [Pseudomonadota bacterium]